MLFVHDMEVNKIDNIVFTSGLNSKLLIKEKLIRTKKKEIYFYSNYGIEANYRNNKAIALANDICAQIFVKLSKILNLKLKFPLFITAYEDKDLVDSREAQNFCIVDTRKVLNNEAPYPGLSIFFQNFKNLKYINDITEEQYKNKKTSSSHFLSPFVHEWLHVIQLDSIYQKFGYGGQCFFLNNLYPKKNNTITGYDLLKILETKVVSKKENEIIFDILGEYATGSQNQYLEIFSETLTKFICDSIRGTQIVKNPFDLLKNTPLEFQILFRKICSFE